MRREVAPDGTIFLTSSEPYEGAAGPEGPAGPPGPEGPQGPAAYSYDQTFTFAIPTKTWVCAHNQSPNKVGVDTFDSAGDEIIGDVSYSDPNVVIITWYYPTTGTARVHH